MKKIFHTYLHFFYSALIIGLTILGAFFIPTRTTQPPSPTPHPTEIAPGVDLLIGSTDGTTLWAFIIVLIIILPILWYQFQETEEDK